MLLFIFSAVVLTVFQPTCALEVTVEDSEYVATKNDIGKSYSIKWEAVETDEGDLRYIKISRDGKTIWVATTEFWQGAGDFYDVEESLQEGVTVVTLTIKAFDKSYAGTYQLEHMMNAQQSKEISIYLLDCPVPENNPPLVYGEQGEFNCKLTIDDGEDFPKLYWRDHKNTESTSGEAKLTYTAAKEQRKTKAVCIAETKTSKSTCEREYLVKDSYELTELTTNPNRSDTGVLMEATNKVIIACIVDMAEDAESPQYSWSVNGVEFDDAKNKTFILDVQGYEDVDEYKVTCSTRTPDGDDIGTESVQFSLAVVPDKKSVKDPNSGSRLCMAVLVPLMSLLSLLL